MPADNVALRPWGTPAIRSAHADARVNLGMAAVSYFATAVVHDDGTPDSLRACSCRRTLKPSQMGHLGTKT